MASIYIHIPFCERICSYCDFPKRISKSIEIDNYLEALEKEVKLYTIESVIDTLYLGGGTPSILDISQIKRLESIISTFQISQDCEFTIECNPEHITKEKVMAYKKMGVNRISLGVQTFNNRHLKLLNRGHNKENVLQAVDIIKSSGITNINIDLIYAIPFQTIGDLREDLQLIKQLDLTHISPYSLILEEKTVFEKWLKEKKISLLDNEVEASMFQIVMDSLKEMGFLHYEISNFSKPNLESKHNSVYWHNQDYYGFGMGASGYLNNIRYYNENKVNKYIEKINHGLKPIKHQDKISKDEKIKEEFLLGLRLLSGVNIKQVNQKYNINVLDYFKKELNYLQSKNWIAMDQNIKLTKSGLFYGNEVYEMFI